MRHTLRETWSGLRRNVSMTISVVVTMWVCLALFGAGLLAMQQVELLKGKWYDKIEVSVFMCSTVSSGPNCTEGQNPTEAQKKAVEDKLRANPNVAEIYFENKAEAYAEFQKIYQDNPFGDTLTQDMMPESFRVKLTDPQQYASVAQDVAGLPGGLNVLDLHQLLDPLFKWLNLLKWGTMLGSGLLLLAAALQIGNTIRMAAFARRRELGIMKMVGASNAYIMAPFLLESLVAALFGILLACATLAAGMYFVIIRKAQLSIKALAWIGWPHAWIAMAGVAAVGIALSIIPTLIATRRYLRV